MRAIERHLYSRKGYYYYRKSLPRGLHIILPFKEIWIGLDTQDLSVARMQSVQLDYEVTKQLQLLQKNLVGLLPEKSPEKVMDQFLSEIENIKSTFGYKPPFSIATKWGVKKANKLLFSVVVQKYLDDCPADAHSTRVHKESTYIQFREIMGNMVFKDIGIEEARHFKSCLLKLPANAKRVLNAKSLENIDWDKLTTDKPLHPRTINNRLSYIGALFNWALKTGYYDGQNPFMGLLIPKSQKVVSSRCHPFKPEELEILFHSSLYKDSAQSSMIWVPLIGLYSGMRLNEICQLYVADVRQEEGVYIFDVNDDGDDKGLKNSSSRRKVPIHKELIRKGLLEYINQQHSKGEQRLFSDIPMGSSAKNYSSTFTKRFWRLLVALEIKRQGLSFHSLRHTFIDGLRNSGVERSIAMTITGHQSSKEVHDAYGYGYNLPILQEAINKLSFPSIEN